MTLKLNGTTSGSVSLDAPATGSDVSLTLPGSVGTSGQLLSTNGAGVLSFVNGGKILQIVRDTDVTDRTTTSTSYVDVTGLAVTITPQKSDSAILLITTARVYVDRAAAGDKRWFAAITDNSNNAISGAEANIAGGQNDGANLNFYVLTMIAYATPATTSAVTYKTRFMTVNAAASVTFQNSVVTAQMFAIEVAA